MVTTIDAAGRVVIPKRLREVAGLKPGTKINVAMHDGKVQIEPAARRVRFARRGSVIVSIPPKGTPPLTVEDVNRMIDEGREARMREILYGSE